MVARSFNGIEKRKDFSDAQILIASLGYSNWGYAFIYTNSTRINLLGQLIRYSLDENRRDFCWACANQLVDVLEQESEFNLNEQRLVEIIREHDLECDYYLINE
jgi:hypothetical protein